MNHAKAVSAVRPASHRVRVTIGFSEGGFFAVKSDENTGEIIS
jgi:hypothetical protein